MSRPFPACVSRGLLALSLIAAAPALPSPAWHCARVDRSGEWRCQPSMPLSRADRPAPPPARAASRASADSGAPDPAPAQSSAPAAPLLGAPVWVALAAGLPADGPREADARPASILSPTAPAAPPDSQTQTDEPLWVLPPELIVEPLAGLPGQRLTRERGYLDTPDSIQGAGLLASDASVARVHQNLAWDYCGPRPARLGPDAPDAGQASNPSIAIDTGGFAYDRNTDIARLVGGVRVERGDDRIEAGTLSWNRRTNDIAAEGETFLQYADARLVGQAARINLDSGAGQIASAHYRFTGAANLHGSAELIELLDRRSMRLRQVDYSACPPGDNAWSLRARDLKLDRDSGRGVARHAHLRLGGIPVFYTPYISFPIDDRRKSGFLYPIIGSSDETGLDITLPYYLNLAPNMDATLYPRVMGDRGPMLGGEARFLTARQQGTLTAEVIPHDSRHADSQTRGALRIEQTGQFDGGWATAIDYSLVSDQDYLQDLGNSLEITSTRRLSQRAELSRVTRDWLLIGRVEAFQTLDPTLPPENRAYGRLPQLLLTSRGFDFGAGLRSSIDAEYNFFDHNHRVHGHRLALQPRLSWPLRRAYGHLIPSAALSLSTYALEDQEPRLPRSPSHAIPTLDIDGKLVFERPAHWLGQTALQTLEPRLFYLYTPYEDQDDTPVFDSSELNFSFANLFRANRFTGRDRVGDANQLTLGLTSRTLGETSGDEWFRASVGQIYYFADPRVALDTLPAPGDRSPYVGELAAQLVEHWSGRASVQWDPEAADDTESWRKRAVELRYRHPGNRLLNVAYRFDAGTDASNSYEDTDLSFRLPFATRAELVGRWLYSLQHDQTMEAIAGIEFGECCWRLRLVGRHFKNRPESTGSNSLMVQLELAGLGRIGSSIDTFLAGEIHGYRLD